MFFNPNSVFLIIVVACFLIFAKTMTNLILKHSPKNRFTTSFSRSLLFAWPIRSMGIICLVFSLLIATSGPSRSIMDKDENIIALLENGTITKGEVTKRFYQHVAPAGWKVIYEFDVKEPIIGELNTYVGSSQGPKKYYMALSNGANITIIYDPCNPTLNCEISNFLNHPSHRHTFKKAGKLELLGKFRNKYPMEDYSFKEWFKLQDEK